MAFFIAAFGLVLHILFWGVGLAWAITPRPWRRWWPVFVPVCGLLLQSAVVWVGAHTHLPGSNAYAYAAEALPAALLAVAGWRARLQLWVDVRRFGALWLAVGVTLNALLIPFASSSKVLTTSSLGSCDAADYAAGARTLQEFASNDRSGFIGHTEVVRLHSVDNFFDHWTRLNHFTPSALIALNGSVLRLAPYQLTGVFTVACFALTLPLVFWLVRAGLRYGPVVSGWITLLYAVSPLNWYAVYHVAPAQILAANGLALITWAGVALWQRGVTFAAGRSFVPLLAVGFGLLWGAYNFILIVALVPALAFVGGRAIWSGDWAKLARWFAWVVVPLVLSGLFFQERVAGMIERFRLFQQFDFGWRIPGLSLEGWFGMVANPALGGFEPRVRWILSAVVLLVLVFALVHGVRRRSRGVFMALCFTVPILVGYGILVARGHARGTNASYDAYKLLTVFLPGILGGLAYWATLLSPRLDLGWMRSVIGLLAVVILGLNFNVAYAFAQRMQTPPLIVDRNLAQVQRAESFAAVDSVNMLVPDFWQRLWANSFLLHKPQYFQTHTYEGRLNTPLRGHWDLRAGVLSIKLPDGGADDPASLAPGYSLIDTRSPYYLRARLAEGWYDIEGLPRATTRWRWTRGDATLQIENPQPRPLRIAFRLEARSLIERDLQLWLNGEQVRTAKLGLTLKPVAVSSILVPPGNSTIEFRSSQPPTTPPGDRRQLGFAVYSIQLDVRPDGEPLDH